MTRVYIHEHFNRFYGWVAPSPILFTVYLFGLFGFVEEKMPGVKSLSFVDDVAWMVEGDGEDELSETLERAASAAQEWADPNAVTFDTQKTEAILLSRRRKSRNPAAAPEASRSQGTWSTSINRRPGG